VIASPCAAVSLPWSPLPAGSDDGKAIPHIVQVDKNGAPTYLGPVGPSMRDYHPEDATVKYHLRRFVEETRSISSDGAVVRRNWTDAYSIITPNAANQLSAHAERNDPVRRS
jgi:type IV secretion system protein TrbF